MKSLDEETHTVVSHIKDEQTSHVAMTDLTVTVRFSHKEESQLEMSLLEALLFKSTQALS